MYVLIIYKAVSRINTRPVKIVRVFIESVKWIYKVITKTKRITNEYIMMFLESLGMLKRNTRLRLFEGSLQL